MWLNHLLNSYCDCKGLFAIDTCAYEKKIVLAKLSPLVFFNSFITIKKKQRGICFAYNFLN